MVRFIAWFNTILWPIQSNYMIKTLESGQVDDLFQGIEDFTR